jgi:hypothetical protein
MEQPVYRVRTPSKSAILRAVLLAGDDAGKEVSGQNCASPRILGVG